MADVFIETLRSWQNFYFMTGGAAATLVGLMFVALSLGINLVNENTRKQMEIFVTPSIFYFTSALVLCCIMLVPNVAPPTLAAILTLGGVFGILRAIQFVRHLISAAKHYGDFDLTDWLSHIVVPVLSYALLLAVGIGFWIDQWTLAFMGNCLTVILLLLCGIANTWSLVIWIIEQRKS